MKQFAIAALLALMLAGCRASPSHAHGKRVIVLGVDAMEPGFLLRHFDALPNLKRLRDLGGLTRLATTSPPQSPVAWSTFITGTDPEQTGVFDFVQRDPATGKIFRPWAKPLSPRIISILDPTHSHSRKRACACFGRAARFGISSPNTASLLP
jgi:predicted AlkP superfamily pyrophosphatase or phosphodiesterase